MIFYASRTGTKRNLAAFRRHDWRLLLSRVGEWKTDGFPYALDNGAWHDFRTDRAFDEARFWVMVDRFAGGADWLVAPDIVAGGRRSLDLTLRHLDRCRAACRLTLIAVQDGIAPDDVRPFLGPGVGVFLGGSTAWKLENAIPWGRVCADLGVYYHFARVNSAKRMFLAIAAAADSGDGSSGTRYAKTVPMLDGALRHQDFFNVRRGAT